MEELTRYGSSMTACARGGTPPAAGWRGSEGRWLRGRGATASLGGGCCDEGGLGGKPKRPIRMAVLGGQGCDGKARRGEREGEAFGVELAEVIGEREGSTLGHEKLWHSWNLWVVRGGQKTTTLTATAVRTGGARSETNSGSVTVVLGRAQFGAH
jgi:hypothetical protein